MHSQPNTTIQRRGHLSRAFVAIALLTAVTAARSQTVSAQATAEGETVKLPTFEVTASQDNGYRASNSVSATRINTPIRDLPLTVEAFTEEFIKDLQPRDLLDIVAFAPGVSSAAGDFAGGNENFNIRGFSTGNPLRNGFKGPNILDPATIARVEVVRGPSSLLYGTLPPGGLVNYITKRPLDQAQTILTQRVGTDSLYRTELDTTGPVGDGSDFYYRFVGSYDHNHQFYAATEGQSTGFAPMLQWRTANSAVTLDYQHFRRRENAPIFMEPFFVTPGFQFLEKVPGLPRDFNALGDDDFRGSDTTAFVADWQLKLAGWDVRANYAYARQSIEHFLTATLFIFDSQRPAPMLTRTATFQTIASKDETGQAEATRSFKFGSSEFKVLTGYAINRRTEYFGMRAIPGAIAPPAWDLRNPATWNRSVHFDMSQLSVVSDPSHITTDSDGIYGVGHLSLMDGRFGVLGGMRYSKIKSKTFNDRTAAMIGVPINQSQTSPQIGVLFKLTPQISAYASYSESFVPTGGVKIVNGTATGGFDPTVGKGYDVGFKAEFFGGRLSATLAGFQLENTGIVNSVITGTSPVTGLPVFTTFQSGTEASKGVEFSGVYTPANGWQMLFSYSYLDAYVKTDRSNPARVGLQLTNTAHQYFNFWAKYTMQDGDMKGLYFAGGVNYTGERLVHISNQALFWDTLPLVTAAVGYTFTFDGRPLSVDLSGRNLLNKDYSGTNNSRGEPRLFILSLSTKF